MRITTVTGILAIGALVSACGGTDEATGGAGGAGGASSASSAGAGGGSSSSAASSGSGGACMSSPVPADPLAADRAACSFKAGADVLTTLGITAAQRAAIPIKHIVIVTEENRSFDHYFGKLSTSGQPAAEGPPAGYVNKDLNAKPVAPYHLTSTCLPADPPHQWIAMHAGWDGGAMDGFVKSAAVQGSDGHYVMGYYDATDIPFYYWLASTFAISDRYFGAALGGTWANRDYLYTGTSMGVMNTGQAIDSAPSIFDALTKAGVSWGVYTDGGVRQDCLGWTNAHAGVGKFQAFLDGLSSGTLPAVSFVDPGGTQDEHPPADIQGGEAWARKIYTAAVASPLWSSLAIIYTYDESGGLADHVPPPSACIASPDQAAFDHLGVRIPLIVISPWARPAYVSHVVHEHSSALRLIELVHDLPALTARDANSDALLDLFDFSCAALTSPPDAPAAGVGGCP